jgi:hypothetical protein
MIHVEEGKSIRLTVEYFESSSMGECDDDSLVVYNGRDDQAQTLMRACNSRSVLHTVTSSGNYMYVRFVTDELTAKGFTATYESVDIGGHSWYKEQFNKK